MRMAAVFVRGDRGIEGFVSLICPLRAFCPQGQDDSFEQRESGNAVHECGFGGIFLAFITVHSRTPAF